MKNKILSITFCLFIFTFFCLNILIKDKDVSFSERRYLSKLPEITIDNILNGNITSKFETYSLDQFVLRDSFRSLKTNIEFYVLRKLDYNNLYLKNNYIYKIEYPLKENKVKLFTTKINNLYDKYLTRMNVYYSIIPDKNYYQKDEHLRLDYDKLFSITNESMNSNIKYIDITNILSIEDYYFSDIHWKQENLEKVVKELSIRMNFQQTTNYIAYTYEPFYGSYYCQLGLNSIPDKITYLTNSTIEQASIYDYENKINSMYKLSSLGSIDSYDVYLGGGSPYIEIINNNNKNAKELVIFRDSFASSLAPLLLEGYSKITLIDLRYMSNSLLDQFIEFKNQDILFLYNTSIINNSDMIK